MKKPILIFILIFLHCGIKAQNEKVFDYSDSVFEIGSIRHLPFVFDFNGGFILKDSITLIELKKLGDFINSHRELKFDIEHHCDSRGSEKYNQRLSEGRSQRISNELIGNYSVDSSQIRPVGYGETRPIVSKKYHKQMNMEFKDECFKESVHFINRRSLLKIREIIK